MLTFFRVKSFPVWFLDSVLTSAAYTHHELFVLSGFSVCVVWVLLNATSLCHGIVLYPSSRSFHFARAGTGRPYAHVFRSIYIVYPKSLTGPLAVQN